VLWTAIEAVFRVGFQFGVTVALARLLSPEEFGIVAIVYVFTQMGSVLVDGGFTRALVQQRDATEEEISAVFHFQWMFGLLLGIALNLAAPWIAAFYGHSILDPLTRVLALDIFLSALGGVQRSLLDRTLAFRQVTIAGLISSTVAGVIAVLLAYNGAGVWALAAQALMTTFIYVAALWLANPWRPRMVFRPALLKRTFVFGQFLLLSGLLEVVYGRLYGLVIGKVYGFAELGQYTRAVSTQAVPAGMLGGIVARVAFAAFAAIQDDKPRIYSGLRKGLIGVMAITIPVMLGLLAVAKPFVLTFFGEAWSPSIPLFRILCLAGLVLPMHMINLNVLLATGHASLFFRIEVIKKTCGIILFLSAVPFGLEALAWSQVLYSIACFATHAHYTGRLFGFSGLAQLRACSPWLLAGVAMACVVWSLQAFLSFSMPVLLAIQVLIGAILYMTFWILWDPSQLREMIQVVLSRSEASDLGPAASGR
jgi:O-antigen/teichoic acid export membrane protein